MSKNVLIRLLLDIVILLSVMNGWWFFALPLALIGAWLFPYFIEIIVAGIAYDSLFGFIPAMRLWGYAGTIVSIVLFAGIVVAKKWVR